MKKNMFTKLALTLAVVCVAGQVHAIGEKDSKSPAERDREVREAARNAGHVSTTSAREAALVSGKIDSSNLNPDQTQALKTLIASDADVLAKVKDVLAQPSNAKTKALLDAQLAGLSNLGLVDRTQQPDAVLALNESARNDQAYLRLVTKAAVEARSWSGSSQEVVVSLLQKANANISQNMKPGDALAKARDEVQQEVNSRKAPGAKQFALNLDDILKSCKN